jgi:4-amino-4-deoxy-L-arabinose transferase-like glycosyltransferase
MREAVGRSVGEREGSPTEVGERVGSASGLLWGLVERAWRSLLRAVRSLPRFWRSPEDQPPWARPALLGIAAVAGLAYGWGMNGAALEDFYGAAARSMSGSWHDFFFGAFDPAGTMSVDKLPGALWPQALSLRIFGFHVWAIVLPQVIEGVLTILVLYRAVRRLAGPLAGIVAAAVLATSPVTVALNRGNVADSLLILLLVLAADATSAALLAETGTRAEGTCPPASVETGTDWGDTRSARIPKSASAGGACHPASVGRLRTLLLAGVWVGLAFQAKMLAAWLVLPALAAAYLLAAPPRLRTRLGHVALAGVVTVVVSLSWMTVVSLVPAHERPYVDGTQNDSLFSQVFDYNGISRLGRSNVFAGAGHPARFLVQLSEEASAPTHSVKPGLGRLLSGVFGRDDGWLLPAALIAAVAILLERRRARADRRDPLRAAAVLWGTWLVVLWAFFSAGGYPNSYYVAALSPATGALCGAGLALAWRYRGHRVAPAALAGTLVCCVGYGIYLLQGGTAVPGWLAPTAAALGLAGALALWRPPRVSPDTLRVEQGSEPPTGSAALHVSDRDGLPASRTGAGRLGRGFGAPTRGVVAFAVVCALLLPGVAAALMVTRGLGPFAAPYEPVSATLSRARARSADVADEQVVDQLASTYDTPIPLATDSSILAAPFILATGSEVLPIGGFQGGVPSPTLARLQRYIAAGEVRAFLVPVHSNDPRVVWIHSHCTLPGSEGAGGNPTALYICNA